MRNYKKIFKEAEGISNYSIVVSRDELIKLRLKYDDKYTLKENKLQNVDVFHKRGKLNGIDLSWGEWL